VAGLHRARRVGWAFADQALSSVTNFAMGLWVARTVDATDFGGFSLMFATYALFLGAMRAVITQPLLIRHSHSGRWREAVPQAQGTSLVLGSLLGIATAAAAPLLAPAAREPMLALAITLPGLMWNETLRYSFFANDQGKRAFCLDAVWAGLLLLGIWIVSVAVKSPSSQAFALAWGLSAGVAALGAATRAKILPRLRGALGWLRDHRDLAPALLAEFVLQSGGTLVVVFVVAAVGGLAEAGGFRAAQLLLGPLTILFMGSTLVAIPEAIAILDECPRQLPRAAGIFGGACAAIVAVWGALLVVTPTRWGTAWLGSTWFDARPLVVPLAVGLALTGVQQGASTALRSLGDARRTLRARAEAFPALLVGVVWGAWVGGAQGASWGLAWGLALSVVIWWSHFHRAWKGRSSPVPPNGLDPALATETPVL
jgi:O-antigen/teichoic acid export membrane protein